MKTKEDSDYGHGVNMTEYRKTKTFMRDEREKKRYIKNAVLFVPRGVWRSLVWVVNLVKV